ncbi:hypothetical protein GCM10009569_10470 [Arthrobacter russicus]
MSGVTVTVFTAPGISAARAGKARLTAPATARKTAAIMATNRINRRRPGSVKLFEKDMHPPNMQTMTESAVDSIDPSESLLE